MNGQTMSYKEMLQKTQQPKVSPMVFKVRIDYHGLRDYAKKKGSKIFDLSDEEKNEFIKNSSMKEIRAMNA